MNKIRVLFAFITIAGMIFVMNIFYEHFSLFSRNDLKSNVVRMFSSGLQMVQSRLQKEDCNFNQMPKFNYTSPEKPILDKDFEVCSFTPDHALWLQYEHFVKAKIPQPKTLAEAYVFSLDHIPKIRTRYKKQPNFKYNLGFGTSLVVGIVEQLNPAMKMYEGGSFYRVSVAGPTYNYICPVQSHFDGNYTACCYVQPECSTITISLKYVNYAPFWDNTTVPFTKHVHSNTFCPPVAQEPKFTHICKAKDLEENAVLGRWVLPIFNRKLTWAAGNCFVDPRIDRAYWEKCLAKNKVTILGDSHQHYSFYGIKKLMGQLNGSDPMVIRSSYIKPGLNYFKTKYPEDMKEGIKTLLMELKIRGNVTKNDVILFSFGSWSHGARTIQIFLKNLELLFRFLKSAKRMFPELRLVYWSPPSVPDGVEMSIKATRRRNQFGLGATTSYVRGQMKKLGVEVLDMFNPTNIRNSEYICGTHYICRRPNAGDRNVAGEVGLAFLNNLAIHICES